MTSTPGSRYEFADLTFDAGQRRVDRGGEPIELGKLSFLRLIPSVRILGASRFVASPAESAR
jgi:DNA-binding response OmpR family regulator